jgi:hypothetical protein
MTRTPSPETPVSGDELAAENRQLRAEVGRLGIGLRHVLACMDTCEEAGGSPAELDPEDRVLIDETRRELAKIGGWAMTAPTPSADVSSLERVARAIHDARYGNTYPKPLIRTWEQEDIAGKEYCERLARAAIAAHDTEAAMRLERYRGIEERIEQAAVAVDSQVLVHTNDPALAMECAGYVRAALKAGA